MAGSEPTTKRFASLNGKDEYSVVEMKISWGLLSLLIFFFSLPVRAWVSRLPWHPYHYWYRPGSMILATLALAFVGMLLAWLGLRQDRHSKLSRWALLLNSTVFGLLILAVGVLIVWWQAMR